MPRPVRLSVRQLVEFILRGGDIDAAYMSVGRAPEGVKTHKRIQKMNKAQAAKDGGVYQSEYTLRHACLHKGIFFEIEGRADGIIIKGDSVVIEEIKSTVGPAPPNAPDESHWHLAQAKCYAYMYLAEPDNCADASVLSGGSDAAHDKNSSAPRSGINDTVGVTLIYSQIETET
ncbi:MAG: hypothetical protein FWF03_03230, partial [Defluviitaleaceae bacterium]|nr:hypothetical protein [Defluviitaleaceae bacterium]